MCSYEIARGVMVNVQSRRQTLGILSGGKKEDGGSGPGPPVNRYLPLNLKQPSSSLFFAVHDLDFSSFLYDTILFFEKKFLEIFHLHG